MAAEYGWASQKVDRLTDEKLQLVYLDSAVDRKRSDFRLAVEAGRAAAIYAAGPEGQKQYDHWRREGERLAGRRPTDTTTLEQFAKEFSDHVRMAS